MTLVSMGLTVPDTPLFVSGTVAEVEDLTVSDKDVTTDVEINAGVHTEDMTRKLKDSECKKKERAAVEMPIDKNLLSTINKNAY
jgi:hypothetical protein